MDMDLYKSNINVTQTYEEWKQEAIEFYERCEYDGNYGHHPLINLPKDWWERWVKVLGLEKV